MRIVLLGDLHVHHSFVWPWRLIGKRFLGQMNLWLNRRKIFKLHLLAELVRQVAERRADLQLFSGDLTTTALPIEFQMLQQLAQPIMEERPTFIVPGNHDRYTFLSSRKRRFEQYFQRFSALSWPSHRQLAPQLHLVGLDPTRPTLLNAQGKLGEGQLKRLEALLADTIHPKDRVIVLCHYPLRTPPGYRPEPHSHALIDADRLAEVLAQAGHEMLYLHGHVHAPWCWRLPHAPNVVAINAGAPVMIDTRNPFGQGFWEIELSATTTPEETHESKNDSTDSKTPAPLIWALSRHVAYGEAKWRQVPVNWPHNPGQVSDVYGIATNVTLRSH